MYAHLKVPPSPTTARFLIIAASEFSEYDPNITLANFPFPEVPFPQKQMLAIYLSTGAGSELLHRKMELIARTDHHLRPDNTNPKI